jgi:MFS family permease
LALVAAAGMNFAGTIWFTTLQQHVPQHALSRVSSYDWAGSVLFTPLGFILVGPLADQFGAADVLYAAAVWTIFSSIVILAIPSVRNVRAVSDVPTSDERASDDSRDRRPDLRSLSGVGEGDPAGR